MKDYKKILGREVDEQNRTIFIIENMEGGIERVLYSEVDQRRVRSDFIKTNEERSTTVITFSNGERVKIKSHDENGNKVDVKAEKEKAKNEWKERNKPPK